MASRGVARFDPGQPSSPRRRRAPQGTASSCGTGSPSYTGRDGAHTATQLLTSSRACATLRPSRLGANSRASSPGGNTMRRLLTGALALVLAVACGGGAESTPPPPTYTISGVATLAGQASSASLVVTLVGPSTAAAVTAADGSYSFTGAANG